MSSYSYRSQLAWVFLSAILLSLPILPAQKLDGEAVPVFIYEKTDPYDIGNLYGFNHAPNVTLLPDGRLLAAWFSGPYEASIHQVILGCYSADGGKTWSKTGVLEDAPRQSDYDPAFLTKGETTWMFYSAGRWLRYPYVGKRETEAEKVGPKSFHTFYRKTTDSGKTWSPPVKISEGGVFCRNNGITLRNGTLLLPVYDEAVDGGMVSSVLRSTDEGVSWVKSGVVSSEELKGVNEPAIAELDDGSVLMSLRSRDGNLWVARSTDDGASWSAPTNTGLEAAAASSSLFRTTKGRVFLTYDASKPPQRSPLVMRELDQKTMKWGEPLQIVSIAWPEEGDPFWSKQVCYPSVTELPDGTLVVVWTEIGLAVESQYGNIYSVRVKP